MLEGRPFVISATTVAEVRFGAELAGWGTPRRARLEQRITRSRIVWPGPELIDAYVDLLVLEPIGTTGGVGSADAGRRRLVPIRADHRWCDGCGVRKGKPQPARRSTQGMRSEVAVRHVEHRFPRIRATRHP